MAAPITGRTPTTIGTAVLVAAATWTMAAKWFGNQREVADQMAAFNARLSVIENVLNIRRDHERRSANPEAPSPAHLAPAEAH